MDVKNVFDKFEHIGVYVVDKDTLITYYENPIAEQYTGRRRIDEPCYQAHGNDAMCSICPIRDKNHITLVNRSDYNMIFAVRCEEVSWEGHPSYLITVVKQADASRLTEDEKSMSRMSRALEKSVNVYTEINMKTMQYRQINLRNCEGFNVESQGDYALAYEYMCAEEIHPEDVAEVRRTMAPEVFKQLSYMSDGPSEVAVRYRLKNVEPERIMESRAIFMRDEVPHYVVSIARDVTEESQIQEQANTLEDILSNVTCGVAVFQINEQGAVTTEYVNDGLGKLAECSKEMLLREAQKDYMCTIDECCRKEYKDAFQDIIAGAKSRDLILQATTFEENAKWVSVTLSASKDEKQQLRIYGTYHDVSAEIGVQKEFEEKYNVEKRRSQDDASILAYGVFDLQSRETIEMERRPPLLPLKEKISMQEFCHDIATTIVLEEKKEEFQQIFDYKNLIEKHTAGIEEQSIEYHRRLPNGKTIWVKSSFHVISDISKNTVLLFYYCNDIHINKSLELMTTYMVDEDYDMLGCLNFVDDTAIMLYGRNSSKRLSGQEGIQKQESYSLSLEWFVDHAVVPEEREKYHAKGFVQHIMKELETKESYEFTLHVMDEKQKVRAKKIRYSKYKDDPEICFFSQTDITDAIAEEEEKQKRLQVALQAAEQANEAKTSFLSRMSHDMRTPMNGVLGLASLMKDETSLEEIAKDIEQLEMSGKYLLQLINDTLDVSKIESGKMELRLKVVDMNLIFGNIISNANMLAKEKNVQFVLDQTGLHHGKQIQIMADAARLEQVIMNVISNAIKFTPKNGTVSVTMDTISVNTEEVVDRYIIRDTGIGMNPDFLEYIYEPFAQEGRLNTSRESGTGLGMSIVKQLVELMDGSITIKSEVNQGTEVTLLIHYPISKETLKMQENVAANLELLSGKRILLCEDHPLNAQIAMRLLEKENIKVNHAKNGKIGLEMFEQSETGYYDVILMDIRMPEMNGLESTKAIRGLQRSDAKSIPIIAMTANAFEDDIEECLAVGMNAHVAKPVDPQVLYETISENLRL